MRVKPGVLYRAWLSRSWDLCGNAADFSGFHRAAEGRPERGESTSWNHSLSSHWEAASDSGEKKVKKCLICLVVIYQASQYASSSSHWITLISLWQWSASRKHHTGFQVQLLCLSMEVCLLRLLVSVEVWLLCQSLWFLCLLVSVCQCVCWSCQSQ